MSALKRRQASGAQGRRPDRPGQHARELRRGAGGRRRHDRVRRAARTATTGGWCSPTTTQRRCSAPAADAGGGSRPSGRRARSPAIELDVDLKLPGYELDVVRALREHGLLERALISSQYRESLALIRAAEPRRPAGVVGAQAAPGPVPQPADVGPGHGRVLALARGAALPGRRGDPRGRVRRADGALAAGHAAAGAGDRTAPGASSTSGRWMSRRGSAVERSASPA